MTTDAGGNLAAASPSQLGLATVSDLNRTNEGVAMAMAMSGTPSILPVDKVFAVSANWGSFGNQNAIAVGGAMALTQNLFLSGGGAFGTSGQSNSAGGRAGLTYAW